MIKNEDVVKRIRRSDCLQYEEFDKKYNVETAHSIVLAADGSGQYRPGGIYNANKIHGSSGLENAALEFLDMINDFLSKREGIEDYTFIDIGSGKGRVLFYNMLKKAPYKNYIGIEADPEFIEASNRNLQNTNIELDKPIEFIEINAMEYQADYSNCVYYFYYPFDAFVFNTFMLNNWHIISKTKSYIVFLFEDVYQFERYIHKKPIYDYAEITIYQAGTDEQL